MIKKFDYVFKLDGSKLHSLPAHPFKQGLFGKNLEDALQTLIEKYPEILQVRDMDPDSEIPPSFVVLNREMPIGGKSLDLLLVDNKGVLTLVETKLIQNPESHREVVGQILEYAGSAVKLLGQRKVREYATQFWEIKNKSLDDVLKERFGSNDINLQEFWDLVEENLQKGNIRLIIASDELHPEVKRIIEYLNNEMRTAEFLGLELLCYGEEPNLVFVPHLVGQNQITASRKTSSSQDITWTAEKVKKAYADLNDNKLKSRLINLLEWAVEKDVFMETIRSTPGFGIRGRTGKRIFSFSQDGGISVYLPHDAFAGKKEERNVFAKKLSNFSRVFTWGSDLKIVDTFKNGRFTDGLITQMNDDQFKQFLQIIEKHCVSK